MAKENLNIVSLSEKTHEHAIKVLEELLTYAKQGRIQSFALAADFVGGHEMEYMTAYGNAHSPVQKMRLASMIQLDAATEKVSNTFELEET